MDSDERIASRLDMLLPYLAAAARPECDGKPQPKGIVLVQLAVHVAAFLFLGLVVVRAVPYVWRAFKFAILSAIFLWECLTEEYRNLRTDFLELAWWKRLVVAALAFAGCWSGSYFLRAVAHAVAFGS